MIIVTMQFARDISSETFGQRRDRRRMRAAGAVVWYTTRSAATEFPEPLFRRGKLKPSCQTEETIVQMTRLLAAVGLWLASASPTFADEPIRDVLSKIDQGTRP